MVFDCEALLFDVFGTVVDWHGSITEELRSRSKGRVEDWADFAAEWRAGYGRMTQDIAKGGNGPLNVDIMHREILDDMLKSAKWSHLSSLWNEEELQDLNLAWHRLHGWADSSEGLYALKKRYMICTLSNGNVRLLADMAKFANLPWDVIFSGELLGSYKPNPKTCLGAAHHLSIPPSRCAMVAAHIYDLRAAASHGMKTIYVRRPTEDTAEIREQVKSKAEGGDVDIVVDSFLELATILGVNSS
ncbi:hypothetical protein JAAARDRAFT_62584 [Jaapia argillacea MUCL 33604]|uniref:Haloacid dehalogenase n=1 Tax=Jaapia argillacea MUCL 33604 TaxID=933084 RepID=A0A067P9B8_9AGAM|nr:hypothetical protein JAAARDRAFT_62584 [Jaapia argillacea MUCL 33604]